MPTHSTKTWMWTSSVHNMYISCRHIYQISGVVPGKIISWLSASKFIRRLSGPGPLLSLQPMHYLLIKDVSEICLLIRDLDETPLFIQEVKAPYFGGYRYSNSGHCLPAFWPNFVEKYVMGFWGLFLGVFSQLGLINSSFTC